MSINLYRKVILSVTLAFFPYLSMANETVNTIDDFTAHYNVIHDGDIVGKAKRTLTNIENGQIEFSYATDINWLIFSDERQEKTVVTVENGLVIPHSYKSDREGTGKDKHYHWQFSAKDKTATNLNKKKPKAKAIDWPEGLQSKLSYHLQSRFNLINGKDNFDFNVITTSGRVKAYHYEYVGKEQLMLPFGVIETVKLKRHKLDSKKVTYVWFAPSLNYLMVKLYQVESSFKQIHAELVSVETATISDTLERDTPES